VSRAIPAGLSCTPSPRPSPLTSRPGPVHATPRLGGADVVAVVGRLQLEETAEYERNKNLYGNQPGGDVLAILEDGNQQRDIAARRREFLRELRVKGPLKILLEPPPFPLDPCDGLRGDPGMPLSRSWRSPTSSVPSGLVGANIQAVGERYGSKSDSFTANSHWPCTPMRRRPPKQASVQVNRASSGRCTIGFSRIRGHLHIAADKFGTCLDSGTHHF
jgi:hypothetical protein